MNMAIVYVNKQKFKIWKEKPRYAIKTGSTKSLIFFSYTTNNEKHLVGVIGRKGIQVRYD
jgi:hypothetical protein